LHLATGNRQAGKAGERFGSQLEGTVHGSGPTHQLNDGRGILIVQPEGLVQRVTPTLGSAVIRATQADRAEDGADLARLMGVEAFIRLEWRLVQKAGQFVVEKTLQQPGRVAQGGIPQGALDPRQVQRAGLGLLPDQIERGLGFAVAGRVDRVDFFLAC
jgi:hypothetical protein